MESYRILSLSNSVLIEWGRDYDKGVHEVILPLAYIHYYSIAISQRENNASDTAIYSANVGYTKTLSTFGFYSYKSNTYDGGWWITCGY